MYHCKTTDMKNVSLCISTNKNLLILILFTFLSVYFLLLLKQKITYFCFSVLLAFIEFEHIIVIIIILSILLQFF